MAKAPYLPNEEMEPKVKDFFDKIKANDWPVLNLNRIMAHSSGTVRELIKLGNRLLTQSELTPRYRELAVIRAATLCGSLYEFAQHVSIALEAGLTEEQLHQIDRWKESDLFNDREKIVLSFVEEVFYDHQASDATFEKAADFLNSASLVELTLAVGYWSMIAKLLNTFDVEIDENVGKGYQDLWPVNSRIRSPSVQG
jgi:AhpD family alkylhydroperoxidase